MTRSDRNAILSVLAIVLVAWLTQDPPHTIEPAPVQPTQPKDPHANVHSWLYITGVDEDGGLIVEQRWNDGEDEPPPRSSKRLQRWGLEDDPGGGAQWLVPRRRMGYYRKSDGLWMNFEALWPTKAFQLQPEGKWWSADMAPVSDD